MKTKIKKSVENADSRINSGRVMRNYNLEIELVHNANKKVPSLSPEHKD